MANYKLAQTIAGINPNTDRVETVSVVDGVLQTSGSGGGGGSTTVDFGTKIDVATIPAGGVGNLGWLSAIWKLVSDRLPLTLGEKPAAESLSVAIASDQGRLLVNAATSGLISPNRFAKSTTAAEDLIPAPTGGQKIKVYQFVASNLSTSKQTIIIQAGADFPYPSFIVEGEATEGIRGELSPVFELPANTALSVSQSVAASMHYAIQYTVGV